MTAQHVLDRARSIPTIDALSPDDYATEVARELPPVTSVADLAARDAVLTGALHAIDELAARVMRLRLDHALPDDTVLAAPTRRVFASTIVSYAGRLSVLGDRVRDVASRMRTDADALVDAVMTEARVTLDQRESLRAGVLALVRSLATATIPDADRRARDPDLDAAQRKQWSAARRDLETLADEPARITAAPMAARLAAWPEQLDEPAAKPEPTLAELIELD
ncbi:MAG: hypothetical protein M4D80_24745 [Myxococcota bacterium]|nr:hypothetical protein [Myxococcota bacterium]